MCLELCVWAVLYRTHLIKTQSIYYVFLSNLHLPCQILPLLAAASAVRTWLWSSGGNIGAFCTVSGAGKTHGGGSKVIPLPAFERWHLFLDTRLAHWQSALTWTGIMSHVLHSLQSIMHSKSVINSVTKKKGKINLNSVVLLSPLVITSSLSFFFPVKG